MEREMSEVPERIWVDDPAQAEKHSIFGVVIADYRADERYVEYVRADLAAVGWQDISTAPRDGTRVDLWSSKGWRYPDARFDVTDYGDPEAYGWTDANHHGSIEEGGPYTHWQPMPAPPKAKPASD